MANFLESLKPTYMSKSNPSAAHADATAGAVPCEGARRAAAGQPANWPRRDYGRDMQAM